MRARLETPPVGATGRTLLEIARRHGTPTYAFDLGRLKTQVARLREHFPAEVEILYSFKANGSLGLCGALAALGLGADVASAGELFTAVRAGFAPKRIFVAGPCKSPETLARLRDMPGAIVSIDSLAELEILREAGLRNACVLRLRPDFDSAAVVVAGPDSRFGVPPEELEAARDVIASGGIELVGFHVYAGSQVVDADAVNSHLRGGLELALRAARVLDIAPAVLNLGGGFGVPYATGEPELDLARVGEELRALGERAPGARIVLELGRYLVAQAGWYLTTIVGHQTWRQRRAVVVDGGTHQRSDLCGLGLCQKAMPPLVLGGATADAASRETVSPTDVLGCLSLPHDVLAESSPLPPLSPGQVLAFPNAGAYGLWASNVLFHGSALPAEVAFDGTELELMRARQPAESVLEGQRLLRHLRIPPPSQAGAANSSRKTS